MTKTNRGGPGVKGLSVLLLIGMLLSFLSTTPAKAGDVPLPPNLVSTENMTTSSVDLNWTPAADGNETKYIVQETDQFGTRVVATVDKSVVSYHVSDLRPNTGYVFGVAGLDAMNTSSVFTVTPYISSNASIPTKLTTTLVSDTEIKISWEGNGTYSMVKNLTTGLDSGWQVHATEYTEKGLACNTDYSFNVVAINGDGANITEPSETVKANTGLCTHYSPLDVHTKNVATSTLDLYWTADPAGNETTFVIQQTNPFGTITLAEVSRDVISYHVTGLKPNRGYTFKVAAKDDKGMSGYSSTSLYTLANTPSGLTGDSSVANQITLSWVSDGTYSIAENITTGSSTPWVVYSSTSTFSNLLCGTNYDFRVISQNEENVLSEYSAPLTVKTLNCATPVTQPPVAPPATGGGGNHGTASGGYMDGRDERPGQVLGEKIVATNNDVGSVNASQNTADDTVPGNFPTNDDGYMYTQNNIQQSESRLDQMIRETKFKQRSDTVKELQTALRNLGFFPRWVKSTGYYWIITRGAVNSYNASK